jgi:cytochrome d ubiquinol oxidase subunit II
VAGVHLYDVPLIFALGGLALYTVLAGADFGAGIWQLTAGGGERGERIRDHAHESMGPVWEANHVWLVFVLTVIWTAYPAAFGSIASTLAVPLFIAAVGVILRGAAYALRSGARTPAELRSIDLVSSLSSILTPFALGTAVGAIASRRVPVGNASGAEFSSWLNPTSILIGALAVASCAYLAGVYLSADAVRRGERQLEREFRVRALAAGALAGAIALGGLAVVHGDAPRLYHGLSSGDGLPALLVSAGAGVVALVLVWRSRFELARYVAALAVAAIVAGWALAQKPELLPGLTIRQAAAPHDTLLLVVVAVLAGGAILFPSLVLLFRLLLLGRFDPGAAGPPSRRAPVRSLLSASAAGLSARAAAACLLGGVALLTIASASWAHAVGVVCLLSFVAFGFLAVAPAEIARGAGSEDRRA